MRTEAPMRRAAIAAHSAALPPPTTRTSTFEAAASLMIAFGRSCSTFPVHRYVSDELIGRRTALSTAWAGPGFIGRRAPPQRIGYPVRACAMACIMLSWFRLSVPRERGYGNVVGREIAQAAAAPATGGGWSS